VYFAKSELLESPAQCLHVTPKALQLARYFNRSSASTWTFMRRRMERDFAKGTLASSNA